MPSNLADIYLRNVIRTYRTYKEMAERAIAQVSSDDDLNRELDENSNSIAIIVKHMSGNLRSRFRDFLTTDGEKPDRNRDSEFESEEPVSRQQLLKWWNDGWDTALSSIEALTPEDLLRTIRIRDEELVVVEALNRSITHAAYHVGQIVYLARHFASPNWTSLSIPRAPRTRSGVIYQ
ncbi:MAG: DinB family protein [Gemmatimonadaceae bacterium]